MTPYQQGFLTKCASIGLSTSDSVWLYKQAQAVGVAPAEYTVQKGDILGRIARQHGVPERTIISANGIKDPDKLSVGQVLKIPGVQPSNEYIVRAGDMIERIARKHGVSAKELIRANNLKNPNSIRVGQRLIIPGAQASVAPSVPVAPAAPITAAGRQHTVQKGDILGRIALQYGVPIGAIAKANGIKDLNKLREGQILNIPGVQAVAPAVAASAARGGYSVADALGLATPFIQDYETFQAKPYKDTDGDLAIGYGSHTIDGKPVTANSRVTQEQANAMLKARLERDYDELAKLIPRFNKMNPGSHAKLMDLAYNGGMGMLSKANSPNLWAHLLDEVNYPDPDKVVTEEYPTYNKITVDGKKQVSPGLKTRRKDGLEKLIWNPAVP